MSLFNSMILNGDECPYVLTCIVKYTDCNGEGCPLQYKSEYFCYFSCVGAILFSSTEKNIDNKIEDDGSWEYE